MTSKIIRLLRAASLFLGNLAFFVWLALRVHVFIKDHTFFPKEPFTWQEYSVTIVIGSLIGIMFGILAITGINDLSREQISTKPKTDTLEKHETHEK